MEENNAQPKEPSEDQIEEMAKETEAQEQATEPAAEVATGPGPSSAPVSKPTGEPASEPASEPAGTAPEAAPMFGISEDIKTKNAVPFQPTKEYPITMGNLVKVEFEDKLIENGDREGMTVPTLRFVFEDKTKERVLMHTEWDIQSDHKDYAREITWFGERIAHIFGAFAEIPKGGIGGATKTLKEYYQAIAKAFNEGVDGTPIYEDVDVWIKAVYEMAAAKKPIHLPKFGNFLEKVKLNADKKPRVTTLFINNNKEALESLAIAGGSAEMQDNDDANADWLKKE